MGRRASIVLCLLLAIAPVVAARKKRAPGPESPRELRPRPIAPEKVAPPTLIDGRLLETTIALTPNPGKRGDAIQIRVTLRNRSKTTALPLIFHYAQSPVSWTITTAGGDPVYATLTPLTPLPASYHIERLSPGEAARLRFVWKQTVRYRDDDGRLVRRKQIPTGAYRVVARLRLDTTYYSEKDELRRRMVLSARWTRQ